MSHAELARTIDDAFDKRDGVSPSTKGPVREAVAVSYTHLTLPTILRV